MNTTHPALNSPSEEERLFRQTVRNFAEREILPIRRTMDEQAAWVPTPYRKVRVAPTIAKIELAQ